jgi:Tfp pilus assembly protein PilN
MIKINLLPYHEKEKKENLARQIFMAVGTLIIFILFLVMVQTWMYSSVNNLDLNVIKKTWSKK